MPDFATRYWGHQYEVIRRGPGGETRHKAWALDVTDDGGRFDPKADLRPGDIVTIKHGRGPAAERVIDTVAPWIADPYQRVTWRPPTGAPSALALTDLHPAVRKGGVGKTAVTRCTRLRCPRSGAIPAG